MNAAALLFACSPPSPGSTPAARPPAAPLVSPDAPASATLERLGDVHRYTVVVPSDARWLTYTIDADRRLADLMSQIWHRGQLVDEAEADALHHPRTLGVVPGGHYGVVLTGLTGAAPIDYRLTVATGPDPWEIEPNHLDGKANALPVGLRVQGRLTDDDRFIVVPGPTAGHLRLAIELDGGAAWLAVAWQGGAALLPTLVDGHAEATVGVMPAEPVTVLLRPVFGDPGYRLRVDEGPARFLVEPNDTPEAASRIRHGALFTGTLGGGVDHARLALPPGPHEVFVERATGTRGRLAVEVRRQDQIVAQRRGRRAAVIVDGDAEVSIVVRSRARRPPAYQLRVSPAR